MSSYSSSSTKLAFCMRARFAVIFFLYSFVV
jgi:hypothetical protein